MTDQRPYTEICPTCEGSGVWGPNLHEECLDCKGTGGVMTDQRPHDDLYKEGCLFPDECLVAAWPHLKHECYTREMAEAEDEAETFYKGVAMADKQKFDSELAQLRAENRDLFATVARIESERDYVRARIKAARKAVQRGHYHHARDSYCFDANAFAALMEALGDD